MPCAATAADSEHHPGKGEREGECKEIKRLSEVRTVAATDWLCVAKHVF